MSPKDLTMALVQLDSLQDPASLNLQADDWQRKLHFLLTLLTHCDLMPKATSEERILKTCLATLTHYGRAFQKGR